MKPILIDDGTRRRIGATMSMHLFAAWADVEIAVVIIAELGTLEAVGAAV